MKKKKKQLYDTLAYIFIWKEYNAKHFVAFCSFYKPECVFDSFANKGWRVDPGGKCQGTGALSHDKQTDIQCFAELFYLCRGLFLNVYF